MKVLFLLSILLCPVLLAGSELGRVVLPLGEPTVAQARKVLDGLAALIAEGDARTVTLGKKMERSVRRIFTAEHKVLEAKKKADEEEERAKQLEINGRRWLRPNVHGRSNKVAAQAAFEESRAIRLKSGWKREELSREWANEVADFEKMLGDLDFSKEEQALLVLAETLVALVERTPWVERPELAFNAQRLAFLKERVANKDRWMLLGRPRRPVTLSSRMTFTIGSATPSARFKLGASWRISWWWMAFPARPSITSNAWGSRKWPRLCARSTLAFRRKPTAPFRRLPCGEMLSPPASEF